VKFQTHIAAAETLRDAPNPPYFKGEPRFEYFTRTGFSLPQWKQLAENCRSAGVEFLSSPFSLEAVDLLEEVGVGSYKIPSGEVTNIPLLRKIAATKKPVLLSSGMSDWAELDAAVAALHGGGLVTVLQCSSAYPCPPEQVGLNVMTEMRDRYGLDVGFSDHTLGVAAAIAAAALGASVIEKHLPSRGRCMAAMPRMARNRVNSGSSRMRLPPSR
jgi:N-acetylneuraminate synthase